MPLTALTGKISLRSIPKSRNRTLSGWVPAATTHRPQPQRSEVSRAPQRGSAPTPAPTRGVVLLLNLSPPQIARCFLIPISTPITSPHAGFRDRELVQGRVTAQHGRVTPAYLPSSVLCPSLHNNNHRTTDPTHVLPALFIVYRHHRLHRWTIQDPVV